MRTTTRNSLLTGLAMLALLVGGCTSTGSTPYQPLTSSGPVTGGYSDRRLAEGVYRVTFAGNRLTSRETVESSLLLRAAELTVEQGYDWFEIQDREIERQVERRLLPQPLYNPWFARDYYYWRPYWRYYRPSIGWNYWYPYTRDPFWADRYDVRTIETFEASAEISMGRGPVPATNLRAFDARDVIARIGSAIRQREPG